MLGFGKKNKKLTARIDELEDQVKAFQNLSWHDMDSDQYAELFGALPGSAGVSVTPTSAKRSTAVYACVNLISGAFGITRLKFYERKNGSREEVDHDLGWLFNTEPNPTLTASSMWDWVVGNRLLRGDGLIEIKRNRAGQAVALENVHRQECLIERHKEQDYRLNYFVDKNGRRRSIFQEDIVHIPGSGFDGVCGESVIKHAARDAVGTALAADQFSGSFFARGANPSMVIQYPQGVAPTTDQQSELKTQFDERYSGNDNHHRPMVLVNGGTAAQVSLSAEDAQLIETRKFQINDIARVFGVPPILIGESEKTSSWGTGIEQIKRSFLVFALNPSFRLAEQEVNRKLFPRNSKVFAEFDREGWLSGDSKAEAEYLSKALGGPGQQGWMKINEARAVKNLPPVDGGNKIIMAGQAGEQPNEEPEATNS